ncbi:hypothetical protein LMH73_012370, partial [Vibrio splendidus]
RKRQENKKVESKKIEIRKIGNREINNRKEKAPFPLREPGLVGRSEPVWRSSRNEHISDSPLHSYRKNE